MTIVSCLVKFTFPIVIIYSKRNKPNLSSIQGILVTDISDHLPIIYIDYKGPSLNNDDFIYRRNLSPRYKQAFRNALATLNWDEIYHETDLQMAFSRFHPVFLNLYNTHIPKRQIKLKYNTRKLWLTQGLKSAIKTKNKMYKTGRHFEWNIAIWAKWGAPKSCFGIEISQYFNY